MSVYKRPGQPQYSFDFRYRGVRFSGSTGCTTKRAAEQFEEAERQRVKASFVGRDKPMTFAAASSLYWDEVGQFHKNSHDTERALAWLQVNVGKATLISSISDADIARLVAKRRGEDVSAATVNRSVNEPMRAILRRAGRTWKQSVQTIEWKTHFLREPQERIREASKDEEAKFIASLRPDYVPVFRFAILSGCRMAEIVGLTWSTVDFFNRSFTVTGKGDRSRTIPMTDAIHSLLWSLKDHHATAVFTYQAVKTRDGRERKERYPITIDGLKSQWRRAKEKAGVPDFRFHDTRHTAATRLVRATGNLKLAQKLLGHTEIATTSRYSHVTDDDLRAGMEASNPTGIATKRRRGVGKALKTKAK